MAGFASGFGSAFSNAFTDARKISAQKEADMFKLKYADYISRRDDAEKLERESQDHIKAAKAAVARAGLPAELWGEAYKILRDGGDIKYLDEYLTTNQFDIEATSVAGGDPNAPATPQDSLPFQAQGSVDAQMVESGMQPPADKGIFGNLKASMGMGAQQPQDSRDARITGDIAQASGTTPEQVQQTLGPRPEPAYGIPDVSVKVTKKADPVDYFKANSMKEAATNLQYAEETGNPEQIRIAKEVLDAQIAIDALEADNDLGNRPQLAAYQTAPDEWSYLRPGREPNTWVDTMTGQQVQPEVIYDKNQMSLLETIGKENAPARKEYNAKATNFIKAARETKDMVDIVNSDPRVLGAAGAAAKYGTELARDASGLISLVSSKAQNNPEGLIGQGEIDRISQAEDALMNEVQNFVPRTKMEEAALLASKRTLLEIKAVKYAYAQAASLGQTGAGVAAKEFDRFYQTAIVNDPKAWKQSMQDYIANEHANLKQMSNQINTTSTGVDQFEGTTGTPVPFHKAADIDEQLAGEGEELRKFIQLMQDGKVQADPDQPNANQMNSNVDIPEGYKPTGTYTKDGRPLYIGPDGTKGTFN